MDFPERSPQPLPIAPRRQKALQQLLNGLGIGDLPNPNWLLMDEALVHCSSSASRNYERLEFFGDAVLRLAASNYLLTHYQNWSVGDMTSVRNVLVSDRYLSKIARHYQLETYLVVGDAVQGELLKNQDLPTQTAETQTAETQTTQAQDAKIHTVKARPTKNERFLQAQLADAVESLIGAIYQTTQSLQWVQPWLEPFWQKDAIAIYTDPTRQNHKAALQEWTQEHFKALPNYVVSERVGTVSATERFEAQVWFRDTLLGSGMGATRKTADQDAARQAIATRPDPTTLSPSPSSPQSIII